MIADKFNELEERFFRLEEQLSDPDVFSDKNRYASLSRDYKELKHSDLRGDASRGG